jgi:hypothetical protein
MVVYAAVPDDRIHPNLPQVLSHWQRECQPVMKKQRISLVVVDDVAVVAVAVAALAAVAVAALAAVVVAVVVLAADPQRVVFDVERTVIAFLKQPRHQYVANQAFLLRHPIPP